MLYYIILYFPCTVTWPGEEARKVFDDAQKMLKKVVETKSLRAVGQVAFYPSNSVGDDMYIYGSDDERKGEPKATFYGLRQQVSERLLGTWGRGLGR